MRFFRTKGGKITLVVFSVLFLLVGSGMCFVDGLFSGFNHVDRNSFGVDSGFNVNEEDESVDPNLPVNNDPSAMQFGSGSIISDSNILNILLIGSDTRGNEKYGRSDSMMIVSINKKTKQVKLTSLLRDMYVKIDGLQDNRINVAYGHGGPKLLADTIEKNFRVKLDNYVMVDFESFKKLINMVGGVQITLTQAEANEINNHPGTYFTNGETQRVKAGLNTLNGAGALAYSRIRHIDSDFNRTQRQRTVIEALLKSMKSSSAGTIWSVVSEMRQYVQTDLTNSQLFDLSMNSLSYLSNPLQQLSILASGAYQSENIRGMAVLVPNIEKNKALIWKFIYNR
ncbi:MAG: LytR family transcriptional regulator [Clostridiales bacterium]|nr:LytR family transcriptional regulator [Clostridiales bacterium]